MNNNHTISESIAHLAQKWGLSNFRPLVTMVATNNYVTKAYSTQYNTDVVLKILMHDTKEPEALKLFNGNGCVKLLAYDAEYNGLLLEDITPGTTLSTLFPHDDAQALEITVAVITKLQQIDITGHEAKFPTIQQWMEKLHTGNSKKIPQAMLQRAYNLSKVLLEKPYKPSLLHGDMHHENILHDGNSWIAIDPKGVMGPVEFEVIRFMMNPKPGLLEQHNVQEITLRRIEQLHTLFGFEKQRLLDWLFVQAILSARWAEHDDNQASFNYFFTFAKIIEKI